MSIGAFLIFAAVVATVCIIGTILEITSEVE